ncbi:hypothetical protein CLV92_11569 [Kineococcus xinjiangensis]|uniref:Uncharacterized protein n=1 Tax=Kineococcus xinjiangensis TaxID=512762 RepID=A0A2S6IDS0_9ACTN|nr:hypothetical protein [Kineococcus xinjiangensis]PPK92323.1 hypothetical protein CLV92_11569 [Kineococcus xinjiangensis]
MRSRRTLLALGPVLSLVGLVVLQVDAVQWRGLIGWGLIVLGLLVSAGSAADHRRGPRTAPGRR